MLEGDSANRTARGAATLAVVEVGIGSWLHGFHLPLSGQALSLVQGTILTKINFETRDFVADRWIPMQVSAVAAVLKSLSFAGKRLTPMLAIAMQGALFNLGTFTLGTGRLGALLGMTLLCLWSFIQPILLYWLAYGNSLIPLTEYYLNRLNESLGISATALGWALIFAVLLKLICGWSLVIWHNRIQLHFLQRWAKKSMPVPTEGVGPIRGTIGDVLRPVFLLSLILNAVFVYSLSLGQTDAIVAVLKPLAIGLIGFYLLRSGSLLKFLRTTLLLNRRSREAYVKAIALLQ